MKTKYWLEPILQKLRISRVMPDLTAGGVLVDIGCDTPPTLINQLKHKMKRCVGVDIVVENTTYDNVQIKQMDLQKKINLASNSADVITILAVLEHMKYPREIVKECCRILKPGGVLLITVPSPINKPLVELLAKLKWIRPEMIEQHENYFSKAELASLLKKAGFDQVTVSWFEFGFNTYAKAVK